MLKKITLLLTLAVFMAVPLTTVAAEKSEKEFVEGVNGVLAEMVQEVNEKLENGETAVEVTGEYEGETFVISMNVAKNNIGSDFSTFSMTGSDFSTLSTTRSASFDLTLKNTTGYNFEHNLRSNWSYNSSTTSIIGATASSRLIGTAYKKTERYTKVTKQTNSVYNVESAASFAGDTLFNRWVEYDTYWHVRINGTGTYQVVAASIS